jgi:hypothetical protein
MAITPPGLPRLARPAGAVASRCAPLRCTDGTKARRLCRSPAQPLPQPSFPAAGLSCNGSLVILTQQAKLVVGYWQPWPSRTMDAVSVVLRGGVAERCLPPALRGAPGLSRQRNQPLIVASREASCTASMQRWARRLASSCPWARSTYASIASGVSITASRPAVRAANEPSASRRLTKLRSHSCSPVEPGASSSSRSTSSNCCFSASSCPGRSRRLLGSPSALPAGITVGRSGACSTLQLRPVPGTPTVVRVPPRLTGGHHCGRRGC